MEGVSGKKKSQKPLIKTQFWTSHTQSAKELFCNHLIPFLCKTILSQWKSTDFYMLSNKKLKWKNQFKQTEIKLLFLCFSSVLPEEGINKSALLFLLFPIV